jgi:ligand-binding sensor domain-containing protein
MKKCVLFLLTITFFSSFGQDNKLWKSYFSYTAIKDISQSDSQLYAAAENVYFKKNITTNETSTVSTVEGLSGQTISQIYHSKNFNKTIVGHEDGLITIINDADGSVLQVVDIVNKPSVPPNKKRINHFLEHNGKIYIATDFGIAVFDLNTLQFGDTYFIGPAGANIEILQTTIFNGFIYAVAKGYGILSAAITNTNLIDFNQWTVFNAGNWLTINNTDLQLTAVNASNVLFKFNVNVATIVTSFPQTPVDVRFTNSILVVTTQDNIYLYDNNLIPISQVNSIPNFPNTKFTCATVLSGKLCIGTKENGVFVTTANNPTNFENITPNGPDRNNIFAIQSSKSNLWAVYGDYTDQYNPYPLDTFGISRFDLNNNWITTPYVNLFNAKSITRIAIDPKNENQVFFSSHFSGLLKFENNLPSILYNDTNSSLQKLVLLGYDVTDIRINGSAFDKEGNLWMTNALAANGLHVLKNDNTWQRFALSALQTPAVNSFGRLAIDKNGTKWICSNREGLIGFNEKYNNKSIKITEGPENGNLPFRDARVAAVDLKNKLWIGTRAGLRILPNVDSFLTQSSLSTNPIIILEDDLAQELLFEQFITDIVVDGANNKWIATAGAGVFYISEDGQKTFNIFTKTNSPLPSNFINDIDINAATGEVYIATEAGMVSFKGNATSGSENFDNVVIYPNPVRPEYNGTVFVTGLMDKANVKITDIEGNLVYEGISEGGTMLWDTTAFGKYKVSSGVYMLFLSSSDGEQTKVKKVMIVR